MRIGKTREKDTDRKRKNTSFMIDGTVFRVEYSKIKYRDRWRTG